MKNYLRGDIIEADGIIYKVLENDGDRGTVIELGVTHQIYLQIGALKWENSILLQSFEVVLIKDCIEIMKKYHINPDKYEVSDILKSMDAVLEITFLSKENRSKITFTLDKTYIFGIRGYEMIMGISSDKRRFSLSL